MHSLLYAGFSICPKTRAHPTQGLGEQAKVNRLLPRQDLNSLTFLKSPSTLPVRDVTTHIPTHILYMGFLLWYLWKKRPLRTRVNSGDHVYT